MKHLISPKKIIKSPASFVKKESQKIKKHHRRLKSSPVDSFVQLKNIQIQKSTGKIIDKLHEIKPFSVIRSRDSLQQKLHQLYTIHKEKQTYSSLSPNREGFRTSRRIKQECQKIIKTSFKAKGKRKRTLPISRGNQISSSKDNYDDIEKQIATQMINESKKDKKVFLTTISRFSHLKQKAEISFVEKSAMNISLKEVQKQGLHKIIAKNNVCCEYSDDLSSNKFYRYNQKKSIDTNKEDYCYWMKSSNRVIKASQFSHHSDINDTPSKTKQSFNKLNDFIYKRYFKNSISQFSNQNKQLQVQATLLKNQNLLRQRQTILEIFQIQVLEKTQLQSYCSSYLYQIVQIYFVEKSNKNLYIIGHNQKSVSS